MIFDVETFQLKPTSEEITGIGDFWSYYNEQRKRKSTISKKASNVHYSNLHDGIFTPCESFVTKVISKKLNVIETELTIHPEPIVKDQNVKRSTSLSYNNIKQKSICSFLSEGQGMDMKIRQSKKKKKTRVKKEKKMSLQKLEENYNKWLLLLKQMKTTSSKIDS